MILVAFMRQVDATVEGKVKLIVDVHTAWNIIHQNTERVATHSRDRLGFSTAPETQATSMNEKIKHVKTISDRAANVLPPKVWLDTP